MIKATPDIYLEYKLMAIDLRAELKTLLYKDKEYDLLACRHLISEKKCHICMSQPPMIYDLEAKADKPNPLYRTTPDPTCRNCEGSGYTFEEFLLKGKYFYPQYRVEHEQDFNYATTGSNIFNLYILPTENALKIAVNDIMFLIKANTEGQIELPVTKIKKWRVVDSYQMRLDNNKLEYIKVYARLLVI